MKNIIIERIREKNNIIIKKIMKIYSKEEKNDKW